MNSSVVILGCVLLAGCNVQAKHDRGGSDDVKISGSDGGNVSFDLPFAKGEVKLPASAMAHGNFDIDGVKMYPGASINSFHVEANDHRSVVNLAFKAPAPPQQVVAYFADQFRQKGIETSVSGNQVTGTSKNGNPFEIAVDEAANGSQGTIRIDDKE